MITIIPLGESGSLHGEVRGHSQLNTASQSWRRLTDASFKRNLPATNKRIDVNVCVCVLRTGVTWLWPEDLSPMPAGKSTTASGRKARHSHTSRSSDLNRLSLNYRGGANFHLHLLCCTSPPHDVPPTHHCVKHQWKSWGETPTDWDTMHLVLRKVWIYRVRR